MNSQLLSKVNKLHIAAKVIEETEQTEDDEVSILTGRLEQVFTSRTK